MALQTTQRKMIERQSDPPGALAVSLHPMPPASPSPPGRTLRHAAALATPSFPVRVQEVNLRSLTAVNTLVYRRDATMLSLPGLFTSH